MFRLIGPAVAAVLLMPAVTHAQDLFSGTLEFTIDPREDKAPVGAFNVRIWQDGVQLCEPIKGIGAGVEWNKRSPTHLISFDCKDGAKLKGGKITLEVELYDTRGAGKHNNCIIKSIELKLKTISPRKTLTGVTKEYYFETDNSGKDHGTGVKGGRAKHEFEIEVKD